MGQLVIDQLKIGTADDIDVSADDVDVSGRCSFVCTFEHTHTCTLAPLTSFKFADDVDVSGVAGT